MARAPLLDKLARAEGMPLALLGEALLSMPELAPELIEVVEAVADGRSSPEDETLLFHAVHLLGAARETRACAAILRLLRLPPADIEHLLGDAVTENLAGIVIGVFDGSEAATAGLLALLADRTVDEWVRLALFGSLAFLTFTGRVERATTEAFLARFDAQRLADPGEVAWAGWEDAVALLGLADLAPRVLASIEDGRMPEDYTTPASFTARLQAAIDRPDDATRFAEAHLGHIDDLGAALSMFTGRSDPPVPDPRPMPIINPYRGIGRNDPCPCGSGKKFKRCCLPR